jgi:hypothetical protein
MLRFHIKFRDVERHFRQMKKRERLMVAPNRSLEFVEQQ